MPIGSEENRVYSLEESAAILNKDLLELREWLSWYSNVLTVESVVSPTHYLSQQNVDILLEVKILLNKGLDHTRIRDMLLPPFQEETDNIYIDDTSITKPIPMEPVNSPVVLPNTPRESPDDLDCVVVVDEFDESL